MTTFPTIHCDNLSDYFDPQNQNKIIRTDISSLSETKSETSSTRKNPIQVVPQDMTKRRIKGALPNHEVDKNVPSDDVTVAAQKDGHEFGMGSSQLSIPI